MICDYRFALLQLSKGRVFSGTKGPSSLLLLLPECELCAVNQDFISAVLLLLPRDFDWTIGFKVGIETANRTRYASRLRCLSDGYS